MKRLPLVLVFVLVGAAFGGVATASAGFEPHLVHDGDKPALEAGTNQTVRGVTDLSAGETVTVTLMSTDPSSPFRQSAQTTLDDTGSFAATVDLSNVSPGVNFQVTVGHDGRRIINDTGIVVECDSDCERGPEDDSNTTLDYEGNRLNLEAGQGQTVHGHTDLEPGSTVTVVLQSTEADNPFRFPATTTVADNGSFAATLDLSNAQPGTEFTARVLHEDRILNETRGVVTDCGEGCTTSTPTSRPDANTTVVHDGDNLTLEAAANQTIAGHTDLEPGTVLTVRVESTAPENPFLRTTQATVAENGSFEATVDLAGTRPGVAFTVIVHHDGETLTRESGEVVPCETDCGSPSVSTTAGNGTGTALVYDGDRPTLAAGPNQTIEGRTALPADSELTVLLRSVDPNNSFRAPAQATVTDYGTFTATFNLTNMVPGTEFDIIVTHDGDTLLRTTGAVVACDTDCGDRGSGGTSTLAADAFTGQSSPAGRGTLVGGGALLGGGLLSLSCSTSSVPELLSGWKRGACVRLRETLVVLVARAMCCSSSQP